MGKDILRLAKPTNLFCPFGSNMSQNVKQLLRILLNVVLLYDIDCLITTFYYPSYQLRRTNPFSVQGSCQAPI